MNRLVELFLCFNETSRKLKKSSHVAYNTLNMYNRLVKLFLHFWKRVNESCKSTFVKFREIPRNPRINVTEFPRHAWSSISDTDERGHSVQSRAFNEYPSIDNRSAVSSASNERSLTSPNRRRLLAGRVRSLSFTHSHRFTACHAFVVQFPHVPVKIHKLDQSSVQFSTRFLLKYNVHAASHRSNEPRSTKFYY